MKNNFLNINKIIHSHVRLSIMTILSTNEEVPFRYLKQTLSITDGNLNTHLKVLLKHKYISSKKRFVDKKPQTTYTLTKKGTDEFIQYLNNMEKLIKNAGGKPK